MARQRPAVNRLLTSTMADKKLIIADGHHRYETALNYSKEHAPAALPRTEHNANELSQPPYPEAAVMMTFVNMDSDGLVILPTHRVVHSLSGFDPAAFARAAEQFFTVESCQTPRQPATSTRCAVKPEPPSSPSPAASAFLLRSKPDAAEAAMAAAPENQRQLDLSHLHTIILDKLLGLDAENVRDKLIYATFVTPPKPSTRSSAAKLMSLSSPIL